MTGPDARGSRPAPPARPRPAGNRLGAAPPDARPCTAPGGAP